MSKTIRIACKAAGLLSIDLMIPIQERFKTLSQDNYEKLKTEILEDGYSSPIYLWEDPADAKVKILDGHQRHETLCRMRSEGYLIPQLPVVYVEADDVKQAIHKLMAFASQYGTPQEIGFTELLKLHDIKLESIARTTLIPGVDFTKLFSTQNLDPITTFPGKNDEENPTGSKDGETDSQIKQVQLFYNAKNHAEFMEISAVLMEEKDSNLSDLILGLVREADQSYE